MKLAATIIDGVCVDCGENLQEQKTAIKAMITKYGHGNVRCFILYSSGRSCVRKSIAIPEKTDVKKIYEESKAQAKKAAAAIKKAMADEAKKREDAINTVKQAKAKAREKVVKTNHPRS